ncbi:MAG: methyltransferase domain-containing protein [Chloroherpetonaceae bacterium]|nr:methyltransferase domain-containing protein [Chthonomonadaceae bacterium]MDW8206212.1 methyltransferase domain-containing protein [Chloroherpetonaceae bacterium]
MPDLRAFDTPPRIEEPELIDDATQPYADLRASMMDVRRANRLLGGTAVVTRQARQWLRRCRGATREQDVVTFLDVATGSADIPEAVLRVAHREQVPVRIVGLDYSAPILRCAREQIGHEPRIRLLRGDAFRLPFASESFDYVLCSLAFHHFGPEGCVQALQEIERVARHGWLVNDIRRARSAWYLIRAITWLFRMNRLTRHDGPASVLRAYSLPEYRRMVEAVHLRVGEEVELKGSLFYRVALIRNKSGRE